jgi:SH3-like domain-containing protein
LPKLVETSHGGKAAILRNQQGQTDSTTTNNNNNNRSDILIPDNEEETCMLTEAAISRDRNVIKKEAEKITTNIELMWNVTTKVTAIIIEETAKISESIKKCRESRTSRNYEKQTYWALHTYWG